jgi:hypothetical protein
MKHLAECTTWCFTKEGDVESDDRVLTDFCPGYFLREAVDPGRGMLTSCLSMAKALDVPSNLKILIKSDSTLKTHATPDSGKDGLASKKSKDMFRHIKNVHPHYQVFGETISGGTVRDICNSLPTTQAEYDLYDCVIVVVNMNQEPGNKAKIWQDDSDVGVEFMKLCLALRPFKRALLIAGGFGLKWQLSPPEAVKWDHMTSQVIGIANHVGVMATDGRKYYEKMKSAPDGIHLAQEMDTINVMIRMLSDGVNAMFGAKPAGSFATLQRLSTIGDLTASAGGLGDGSVGSDLTAPAGGHEGDAVGHVPSAQGNNRPAPRVWDAWIFRLSQGPSPSGDLR